MLESGMTADLTEVTAIGTGHVYGLHMCTRLEVQEGFRRFQFGGGLPCTLLLLCHHRIRVNDRALMRTCAHAQVC